jgi:hypothetical protein
MLQGTFKIGQALEQAKADQKEMLKRIKIFSENT